MPIFAKIAAASVLASHVCGTAVPDPFDKFLEGVSNAVYDPAANSIVRDKEAFEEMRGHILHMYNGAEVTSSFVESDTNDGIFDCMTILTQPTVRIFNITTIAAPPPPIVGDSRVNVTWMELPPKCEHGSVPVQRLALERLASFRTLQHFFAKTPSLVSDGSLHGESGIQTKSARHKYAVGAETIANYGGTSILSIQEPPAGSAFSLSQQWYSAGSPVQTAECGFVHVGAAATLFIYRTNSGYAPGSGCYNIQCPGFVQTDGSVALGGPIAPYGREGMWSYRLYAGNWFFYFDNKAIGYYPAGTVYGGGPMSQSATTIEYGGETYGMGSSNYPPMGTGQWGTSGYNGGAAYQKQIQYFATESSYGPQPQFQPIQDAQCYRIMFNQGAPAGWSSYFFFGGPGGGNNCGTGDGEDILV